MAGRLVFAGLFLYYGIAHFPRFQAFSGLAGARGTPLPRLAVAVTGLMLLAGATLVGVGAWADLGALVLVAFLLPVAFTIHPFWRESDPHSRATEEGFFLKDVALAGAALTLFALYREVGDAAAYCAAGAILSPSVFSIVSVTFEEGSERNKALGILGAIAGSGAANRRPPGRRPHRVRGLGVDLLRQRADRHRRALLRAQAGAEEPGGRACAPLRHGGSGHGDGEPHAPRLRAHADHERRLGGRSACSSRRRS